MKRLRPFLLMVDSGDPDEPDNRTFGSLLGASAALHALPDRYRRKAWIFERDADDPEKTTVHYRDGQKVT